MASKKIPKDQLASEIKRLLHVYATDINASMNDLTLKFSKEGAKTIKQEARGAFGGSGEYAKGWTSQYVEGRLSSQGVIYNKDVPGLPHLLEKGHAKRNGGRVAGREHIAPVEQEICESFEKAVKNDLQRSR